MAASPGYIFGGNTGISAESLAKRRAIVDAMVARVQGANPRNVGEGINALGGAIASAISGSALRRDEAALQEKQSGLWSDLGSAIGTGGGSALAYDPSGASSSASTLTGDISQYAQSIKDIESNGGDYGIVGPTHPKYGRALGAYQVMEANLPEWTKEAVGREVGADEYLANPGIQDAVFANRFGGYVSKYGNPQDAASAWLTGRPRSAGNTARDVNGTDSSGYVAKFNAGLRRTAAADAIDTVAPVQTASLDPSFMPDAKPSATNEEALTKALAAQAVPATTNSAAPVGAGPENELPAEERQRYLQLVGRDKPDPNAVPYSGPGAQVNTPMLRYDENGLSVTRASDEPTIANRRAIASAVPTLPQPIADGASMIVAATPAPTLPPGQQRIADTLMQMPANVRRIASADAGFDGFAQTDATPYAGSDAPEVPKVQQLAQAMEVGEARTGRNPTALLRVLQSPAASDEQRQLAGQLLNHLYSRQEKLEDRAFEQNSPEAVQKRRLVDAQIAAYGQKDPNTTNDIREYQFAKSQGFTGTFAEYQQGMKKAGAATTTIGGENTSEFVKKSDEAAAKRLGDIVEAGNAAPAFMGDIQQLADLGRQIGTGKGAQITAALGPYADMFGIKLDGLDETQAYNSIVARIAPNMRPAGAGATSDFDARQYLSSLPSLANTPGGNEIITATFGAIQQNKIDAAEIAQRAQSGEIKWQDAEREIRALPNPYQRYREFRKNGDGSGSTTTTPAGGAPSASPTPAAAAPRRARNPQTGAVIEFRNGQWVPAQ